LVSEQKQRTGELLQAISNMVVGIYADALGRGPTRARSFIDHDVVLCLLEETMTKPERRLLMGAEHTKLLEVRTVLQETMREALAAGVEALVGRRVTAVISGRQSDPDVASEVFVLGEALSIAEGAAEDAAQGKAIPEAKDGDGSERLESEPG
jgi:uncharacterized protein YbcI